ncbi:MAG: OmpH family outer membrane protein [Alphaproteobacteria bacterium]|nr:OmpH family outer membrane protein [Alphaproteobacteria bacterium]
MSRIFFMALFSLCFWGAPPASLAETAPAQTNTIAVVDVLRILTQSDAALSVQKQRETLREAFLAEISKTEQALSHEEKELSQKMSALPQEDYAKKRLAYEEKLIDARKLAQSRKQTLEEASNKAMSDLREALYIVVQEIANEKKYALVISNQNVIAGEKSLDITEETLRRLNARVKEIKLKLEK